MVKCTNGISVVEVTEGAFESIFKPQGYKPLHEKVSHVAVEKNDVEEVATTHDFSELLEKPISQWSKNEVKEYAEANGIDLAGTKNVNEAKDRIKAVINSAE